MIDHNRFQKQTTKKLHVTLKEQYIFTNTVIWYEEFNKNYEQKLVFIAIISTILRIFVNKFVAIDFPLRQSVGYKQRVREFYSLFSTLLLVRHGIPLKKF